MPPDSITENAGPPPRRRRHHNAGHANAIDRLPPHSLEAEQGILGCIMLSQGNGVLTAAEQRLGRGGEAFYDCRNLTIYQTMLGLRDRHSDIDLITILQSLKEDNRLDEVGGIKYLNSLDDNVPSAAHIGHYLDIVTEKLTLRKIIQTCTETVSRLYNNERDAAPAIELAMSELATVMSPLRQSVMQQHWTLDRLLAYDVSNDLNAVIGWHDGRATRYLCRGYSAWIISQAGVGKSSLAQQQAYSWALNKPFGGIKPARSGLRILIVQNENDEGDAAEASQGIADGSEFTPSELDTLRLNTKVIRCLGLTGAEFCRWLEYEVVAFRADIVYVDPLLRYAGIDVSRQDQCTRFLNNELDPVLARTGVVMIGIHHTGKPKSKRETEGWTIYDFAYSGIGSSELVNWARAITIVTPQSDGVFHMMLAKRGSRAWATHPNSDSTEPTTSLYWKHATSRIFWEQVPEPPPPERKERSAGKMGRPNKVEEIAASNLHSFCSACAPEGEGFNAISRRLMSVLANNKIDASISVCKKAVQLLVENGKLTKNVADEIVSYTKGPNA